jgi:hypothetical protein
MRPLNALPTNTDQFVAIETANVSKMSGEELAAHRLTIITLDKHLKSKLAETAVTTVGSFDHDEITTYISTILENGFNLIATELQDFPAFVEAQGSKRFRRLIAECVEASGFGKRRFKIQPLRFQRSAIAKSKTIHELRQNVKGMIGPLTIYRQLRELESTVAMDDRSAARETDALYREIEEKDAMITDLRRVLSEIMPMYEPSAKKADLLRQIEEFKASTGCSDKEAGKVFDLSESTIKRLRRDYAPMLASRAAVSLPVRCEPKAKQRYISDDEEFAEDLDPI